MEEVTATTTTTRTKEEIKKEYANLCVSLGEKKYYIEVLQTEATVLVNKISNVNTEMNTLLAATTTTEATTNGSH